MSQFFITEVMINIVYFLPLKLFPTSEFRAFVVHMSILLTNFESWNHAQLKISINNFIEQYSFNGNLTLSNNIFFQSFVAL